MNKKIVIGSIGVIALLILATFPSIVSAETTKSNSINLKNVYSEKTKIFKILQISKNKVDTANNIDWLVIIYFLFSMITYFPTAVLLSIQFKLQHPFESFGILFALLFAHWLIIAHDYYFYGKLL